MCDFLRTMFTKGWLGSRVVSVLDSGAEGPGLNHCRVTVLGKLFTPIVPLFTKQQNWVRGQLQAWRKVMAAYRRVYDSRHLQADCQEPGSAPEPYARSSSMGYLYLFYVYRKLLKSADLHLLFTFCFSPMYFCEKKSESSAFSTDTT